MLFLPSLLVIAILAIATLQGVLALNLAVSGQDFKLTSNGAIVQTKSGLTMYPAQITMKDGSKAGVLIAGIPVADLPKGLCISLALTFPVIGTYTVRLHTSGDTVAKQMTLDAAGLSAGSATLVPQTRDGKAPNVAGTNVSNPVAIGKDASSLKDVNNGPAGVFGIDSPGAGSLDALQASAKGAIIAGTAKLDGLGIHIGRGSGTAHGECF